MTTRMVSCPFCIHLKHTARDLAVCDAFPQGIPDEIKFGYNHHTEPWPGDNGIQFEAREEFKHLTKSFEDIDAQDRETV
jgi:hypothetical protein